MVGKLTAGELAKRVRRIPQMVFINDVSESKKHQPLIRDFLNSFDFGAYRLVRASAVRDKVFRRLRRETKRGKYDLILTGDSGGTLLFTDARLKGFGKKIRRLQYSGHAKTLDWPIMLQDELRGLGTNPRILVLEGDIGQQGYSGGKLGRASDWIARGTKGAEIHVVAGVANDEVARTVWPRLRYVAKTTPADVKRLSEFIGTIEGLGKSGMLFTEKRERIESLMARLREIQRMRGARTGTLPH